MTESSGPKLHNSQWQIVTVKRPLLWERSDDEVWLLNPGVRYVFNANQLGKLGEQIETVSDLKQGKNIRPLNGMANLTGSKIYIERYRDRGIGDLLFLTGPMRWLKHISGGDCKIYTSALADRGKIFDHSPLIENGMALVGPTIYDSMVNYDRHWFIETATEYDEEPDQLNVYDALFQSIGVDYARIDPQFKRPSLTLTAQDERDLDSLYYFIFGHRQLDLRMTPYYVVAPLSHSNLRCAPYAMWLDLISKLSETYPVIIIGQLRENGMPTVDMPYIEFEARLNEMQQQRNTIINAVGNTPLRVVSALIGKARGLVCLDSGPLYIAQALRVPAVSIWGTHHPGVRIGYDRRYMELAVYETRACPASPCYAYSKFPVTKCPSGEQQRVCTVLAAADTGKVMAKVEELEKSIPTPMMRAAGG